ncbi:MULTISPECIES: hypothetical protein [Corynebacterium]
MVEDDAAHAFDVVGCGVGDAGQAVVGELD